jgi:hypothetical protein
MVNPRSDSVPDSPHSRISELYKLLAYPRKPDLLTRHRLLHLVHLVHDLFDSDSESDMGD